MSGAGPDLQFVTELLEEEHLGHYTRSELFAELFRQLDHNNVDAVIAMLPPGLRQRFIAWARRNYDNDAAPSQFFYIGGEGEKDAPDEAFAAIRRWFAAHRDDAS